MCNCWTDSCFGSSSTTLYCFRLVSERLLIPQCVPVKGRSKVRFQDVFCGAYVTFAVSQEGHVYGFGLSNYHQLGELQSDTVALRSGQSPRSSVFVLRMPHLHVFLISLRLCYYVLLINPQSQSTSCSINANVLRSIITLQCLSAGLIVFWKLWAGWNGEFSNEFYFLTNHCLFVACNKLTQACLGLSRSSHFWISDI